ncbi:HNH endonuclease signature motif containing protein [Geodermatophilus poikilotrophus]|uniref:HNH endonuclease n=1 Tax=Geodermatophilus poikilotrophus TaxID=1333667 RepID=UPI001C31E052
MARCSGASWQRSSRPRGWSVSWYCSRSGSWFSSAARSSTEGTGGTLVAPSPGPKKAQLLERAGQRCERHSWLLGRCRATEALQADHVHPHSRGGATDVANGQALCRRHNRGKAARVPWGWELARMQRRRRAYFTPGSVTAVVRHGPRVRSTGVRQIGAVSGARALRNVPVGAD